MGDIISFQRPMTTSRPRILIVGAGFAGLYAARRLARQDVQVTVVDRKNHHTFQPLLYQVALAVLSPAEIASPIRTVFSRQKNVAVLLGEVTEFDRAAKSVRLKEGVSLEYDYLIVAAGATHAYFGHDEWAQHAPGLKTLEDALEIRRRVLLAFEHAELAAATAQPSGPLNFVVIGAGPTGVELAGAIADIAYRYMRTDFRTIDPGNTRVILLEGGSRVLAAFPEDLSTSAKRQLEDIGVEVRLNTLVTEVGDGFVKAGGETIPSAVTLWAAGVAASPLGKKLGTATDRAGRVEVGPDLSLPGEKNVFVIGDLASYREDNQPVPGVAPAAIQMGEFAARQIDRDQRGEPREVFHYRNKGNLATIGKSKAVADLGRFHMTGFFAWVAWLLIHVAFIIGFANRLFVMSEWAWAYLAYKRSARLITGDSNR